MKSRTTIYLGTEDKRNITLFKELYGEMSDGEAIRMALRLAVTRKKSKPAKKQSNDVPGSDQI